MQGTVKRTYNGIPEKKLPRISKGKQEQVNKVSREAGGEQLRCKDVEGR